MRDSGTMEGDRIRLVAPGVRAIDTVMAGERELNAVYFLDGAEPCLVEAGPGADHDRILASLDALGVGAPDLAHVVVTHIHVDHAGGAGALLERFPHATVWVHASGARHLIDPERLLASTARTYGYDRMRSLFGEMVPVPGERVRAVEEGDRIPMGGRSLSVVHTPGHASHHVALHDDASGAMITGEAIGSYLPWAQCFRPALPPPEVDVEAALASIRRIADRAPTMLLTSHFGAVPDVEIACTRAAERIQAWAGDVKALLETDAATSEEAVVALLSRRARDEFESDAGRTFEAARYDVLGSIRMNAQGLTRYWRKHWEGSGEG